MGWLTFTSEVEMPPTRGYHALSRLSQQHRPEASVRGGFRFAPPVFTPPYLAILTVAETLLKKIEVGADKDDAGTLQGKGLK